MDKEAFLRGSRPSLDDELESNTAKNAVKEFLLCCSVCHSDVLILKL